MKGITVNLLLEVKTVECRVRNHFFVAGDVDCIRNDFFFFPCSFCMGYQD